MNRTVVSRQKYIGEHEFKGQFDWCEVCDRPNGDPIHKPRHTGKMYNWYEIHTTSGMGVNRVDHITWVTKEWAKLFLTNWNRAVAVWNNGELFTDKEWPSKSVSQQYYAKLCCTWMLPNEMVEPHCVAEGL